MLYRLYRYLGGQHGLEECFYIKSARALEKHELELLQWFIAGPEERVTIEPQYRGKVSEVGPRLSFETSFSSRAVGICQRMNLPVTRIEKSIRYPADGPDTTEPVIDCMTQEIYPEPLESFGVERAPDPVRIIPFLEEGEDAINAVNIEHGLSIDAADIRYYAGIFRRIDRNPYRRRAFPARQLKPKISPHPFFRKRSGYRRCRIAREPDGHRAGTVEGGPRRRSGRIPR